MLAELYRYRMRISIWTLCPKLVNTKDCRWLRYGRMWAGITMWCANRNMAATAESFDILYSFTNLFSRCSRCARDLRWRNRPEGETRDVFAIRITVYNKRTVTIYSTLLRIWAKGSPLGRPYFGFFSGPPTSRPVNLSVMISFCSRTEPRGFPNGRYSGIMIIIIVKQYNIAVVIFFIFPSLPSARTR